MTPIDRSKVLTPTEADTITATLRAKGKRSQRQRQVLAIYRLSAFVGLRACEIGGLNLRDLKLDATTPHIVIKASATKAVRTGKGGEAKGKARQAPVWSAEALADLRAWKAERAAEGAKASDPVIVRLQGSQAGTRLTPREVGDRWEAAVDKIIGRHTSVHAGRHTWAVRALSKGFDAVTVTNAGGWTSPATLWNTYAHQWCDPAELTLD